MAHRAVTIYALVDPRTGGVRYVGQTVKPEARLQCHFREARKNPERTRKTRWITEMFSCGLESTLRQIYVVERCEADRVETALIDLWYACCDLVNDYRRGHGHSPETCLKISIAAKALSPEAIEKTAAANRGRKRTDEVRAKISNNTKAAMARPDVRMKTSAAVKAAWKRPGYRERERESHLGKKPTDATRAKMRDAQLGRKQSPESIAKSAAANRGQKRTDEARAKMHNAQKARAALPGERERRCAASRGRKKSPEEIAKIIAASRGRKHTGATRAKIGNAVKAAAAQPGASERRSALAVAQWAKRRVRDSKSMDVC